MRLIQWDLRPYQGGLSVFTGLYECVRRHSTVTPKEE
jgi:hypothetical protein